MTDYEPEDPTDDGMEDYEEVDDEYEEYPETNQALPFSTHVWQIGELVRTKI